MRNPKDSLAYHKANDYEVKNALAAKSDLLHNHSIANVTNLQTTLDGKSNVGHNHNDLYYSKTEVDTALSGKSNTGHTHAIADVNNLQTSLDSKASSTHNHAGVYEPANANIQTHISSNTNPHSTTASQVGAYTKGETDTLLNSKSNTSHNHAGVYEPVISKAIGYLKSTDGINFTFVNESYSLASHNHAGVYSPVGHTHAIADVTNLQTTLDSKAASTHNHNGTYEPANANIQTHISSNTNPHGTTAAQVGAYTQAETNTLLNGKANSSHTHAIADVTNLQTTLDGKSSTSHTHGYLPLAGGTLTGNLNINHTTAPSVILADTDSTTTHNKTVLVNDSGNYRFQTYSNTDVFVSNDYLMDKTASGASLHRFRIANVDKFRITGTEVACGADNGSTLGSAAIRWNTIYSSSSVISTSDRNYKTDIKDLEEAERLVALELKSNIKKFKYIDSVDKKGIDGARIHIGLIAQDVRDIFIKHGLNPNNYALFCEDCINEETQETRLALRYEEILMFIMGSI